MREPQVQEMRGRLSKLTVRLDPLVCVCFVGLKIPVLGTSLVVQWLRLHAPNARGLGSIPGQGTRSRMLQLKILHVATRIQGATTKTQGSQINK